MQNEHRNEWYIAINFYSSIIKSQIVYQNNESLKNKAHLLYIKYIEYGSNYEIDLDFKFLMYDKVL